MADILALSPAARIRLAEETWDSLVRTPEALALQVHSMNSHQSLVALILSLVLALPALAQQGPQTQIRIGREAHSVDTPYDLPRNYYGVHLLVDNASGKSLEQLRWARYLIGRGGYAKTFFYNIDRDTKGPEKGWIEYVNACYRLELVPVIRLGGRMQGGTWVKPKADGPGDYSSMARAIERVIRGLPRSSKCPLYIEVWNEPNLASEWSGQASPEEYAAFFVQAAKAIRDIDDPRIKILNGGLALSPEWTEQLCRAQPDFVRSFDLWASHPYPGNTPSWINLHSKTAPPNSISTIDAYLLELDVLKRLGVSNPRVMLTETGYDLGNGVHARDEGYPIVDEYNRADYMVRAFRDLYPAWPEIEAVIPFEFCNQGWTRFDWVYPDSGTNDDGSPSHPHYQYTAVAALAKPTDDTGAINGTIKVAGMDVRLDNVSVTSVGVLGRPVSDPMGNYFFPKMPPGSYRLNWRKAGFKDVTRDVVVKAAANTVLNVEMEVERHETLSGVVKSGDDDRPLAGVKVMLQPGDLTTKANSAGEYMIHGLIPTRYHLKAETNGRYTYETEDVTITAGKTNKWDFRLGKKPSGLAGENLINNASMEAGGGGAGKPGLALGFEPGNDAGGREGNTRINNRWAHTGRCSQEIQAHPEETIVRQITHYNTANPGEEYVAGVWIRSDTSDGAAWMTLEFTDNGGARVQQIEPRRQVKGRSDKWVWVEVKGTAPRGAERLSINFHTKGHGGAAFFDDAYVAQMPGQR